jgi:hypothetical protein
MHPKFNGCSHHHSAVQCNAICHKYTSCNFKGRQNICICQQGSLEGQLGYMHASPPPHVALTIPRIFLELLSQLPMLPYKGQYYENISCLKNKKTRATHSTPVFILCVSIISVCSLGVKGTFWIFPVLYSTLFHLPPLRFSCV